MGFASAGTVAVYTAEAVLESVLESRDTCLISRLSRDMVFLGSVSSFCASSCLMSHDCVLTVSLSVVANWLFCAETLAFLAEGPFTLFTPS